MYIHCWHCLFWLKNIVTMLRFLTAAALALALASQCSAFSPSLGTSPYYCPVGNFVYGCL